MEKEEAKSIVEALLYMTDHPLTISEIVEVIEDRTIKSEHVKDLVETIKKEYEAQQKSLQVIEVAGGVQIATKADKGAYIRRLFKDRLTVRLSSSALETLSIIAYKQPIAKSEIEQIRGVEATGVMDTLLERRLIKVVGRKETIGRPLLYGTTIDFLRQFGLKHLSELPELATISPSTGDEEEIPSEEGLESSEEEKVLVTTGGEEEANPEASVEPTSEDQTDLPL